MSQKEREELYPELARKRPDLVDAFRNERQAADALRACLMSGMYPGMGSGTPRPLQGLLQALLEPRL